MSEPRSESKELRTASYGSWLSPISAGDVARDAGRLGEPKIVGDRIYWTERRPLEGGRSVVLERGPSGVTELVPEPFNVRSRVHEYGGGAYAVLDQTLLFSNFADNRIYRRELSNAVACEPMPVTPEGAAAYADFEVDARRRRLLAVRELDHQAALVAIDITGTVEPQILVEGEDFYSNPRLSPDGRRLLWLSWQHPNMPWDATTLWLGELDDEGLICSSEPIAGGDRESIFQPEWSPEGEVHFVSDRSGFWSLYRSSKQDHQSPSRLTPKNVEVGLPQWVFGMRTYAFAGQGMESAVLCAVSEKAIWKLGRWTRQGCNFEILEDRYTLVDGLVADGRRALFLGAAPDLPTALIELDLDSGASEIVRQVAPAPASASLSIGEPIEFPTVDPAASSKSTDSRSTGQHTAHAFFYPPKNDGFRAPTGELPPLLVKSHGGPTAAANNGFDPGIQFWTSRGFAVVDVNYGGSTGFGRAYRERLLGAWGIVDVDDCVAAAQFLCDQGRADRSKLAIRGGSAGGYTTLAALAFRDVFAAGASHYGIGDLEALARDTHKFESRYLDRLVGPYPQQRELYRQRSPLHAADRMSCPVIFFQGTEDKIVPPNQAEAMVAALRRKGVLVEYVEFAGEGHGFRKAENIARSLEAELAFYARVFGFSLS